MNPTKTCEHLVSIRRINASVLFPCMKNEEDDHVLESKAKENAEGEHS